MKKRITALVLAALAAFSLCACRPLGTITTTGHFNYVPPETTATTSAPTTTTTTTTGTTTTATTATTTTTSAPPTATTTTTTTTTATTTRGTTAGPIGMIPSKDSMDFAAIRKLDGNQVPWGPGTIFDENGRPVACVQLQQKYGGLGAYFVRFDEGKVYLTFDEGYENGYTAAILDVLAQKGVKATFFVTMDYVKSSPELVRRMIAEGHEVGNHTVKHPNMTKVTLERDYDEVAELHEYMLDNFEYEMRFCRPPEGAFSEQTLTLLKKMGYTAVFWSFAHADWDPDNQPAVADALKKATGSLHGGEIFLLHAVSRTNTEMLAEFIDTVRQAGYEFCPLP